MNASSVGLPVGTSFFFLISTSIPVLWLNQWVPGAFSPGVKQMEREVYHSPPAIAQVKNMWI
jgi:hypothetical protein